MNGLELFFNYIIPIYIIMMCVVVGILAFLFVRNKGKLTTLILKPSMQYQTHKAKTETNKLKMSKTWTPTFKPSQVFQEIKASWKFWRLPKRLVILPEQSTEAVGWKDEDNKDFSELSYTWTKKEIVKFIKKEVLKARMELKPMSNMMFYILVIMVIFNLFLTFLVGNRIGVF